MVGVIVRFVGVIVKVTVGVKVIVGVIVGVGPVGVGPVGVGPVGVGPVGVGPVGVGPVGVGPVGVGSVGVGLVGVGVELVILTVAITPDTGTASQVHGLTLIATNPLFMVARSIAVKVLFVNVFGGELIYVSFKTPLKNNSVLQIGISKSAITVIFPL